MKELTFQLVRGRGITSRVIGWFGGDYYSHGDVLTPGGLLRGARSDVIRGVPAGYQDRPYDYEDWMTQTQYMVIVTDEQYHKFWDWSDAQLGKSYDKFGLVEDFVFGEKWAFNDKWWCSQAIGIGCEVAGIAPIPPEVKTINPGDCAFLFAGLRARRKEFVNHVGG